MKVRLDNVLIKNISIGERVRRDFGELEELKTSLTNEGLVLPIAVMELFEDKDSFELRAGERRLRAATELGWEHIPCRIYPYIEDVRMRKAIELKENTIRKDLSYAEASKITKEVHALLIDIKGQKLRSSEGGHSLRATAELLGVSAATVHADIELAFAIEQDPELGKLKNKTEAMSELHKRKEKVYLNELSSRASKKSSGLLTDRQQSIVDGYMIGDAIESMRKLTPRTFNFLEIDPPYGIALRKTVKTEEKHKDLLKLDMEESAEGRFKYMEWIDQLLPECNRVMKDNSWLILWFSIEPWVDLLFYALKRAGFEGTRTPLLWIKNNGNTRTPNIHLRNYYECAFYFRKRNAMLAKPGSRNVFSFPVIPDKIHPNEKPVEMYMDILSVFCTPGSTILSPFAGSGNCLLAAANLNMPAVGIDLDVENRQQFVARVHRGLPGEYSSYR